MASLHAGESGSQTGEPSPHIFPDCPAHWPPPPEYRPPGYNHTPFQPPLPSHLKRAGGSFFPHSAERGLKDACRRSHSTSLLAGANISPHSNGSPLGGVSLGKASPGGGSPPLRPRRSRTASARRSRLRAASICPPSRARERGEVERSTSARPCSRSRCYPSSYPI